jgi:polar amino acid transport system substrate-binding protein
MSRLSHRRFLSLCSGSMAVAALPTMSFAAGLKLAEIKASGELKIGCEGAYVPFTYRQDGKIVGYDVELAQAFCKSLGVKPNFIDTAWAGVIPSLYAKKFDVVQSSMSYTKERIARVAFTIPYADADKIRAVSDLNGHTLAVKLGSPGQVLQEKINATLKAGGGSGFKELRTFDDHPSAYMALAQNRVDGVLNTLPTLAMVLRDAPGKYAIVKKHGRGQLGRYCRAQGRWRDCRLSSTLGHQFRVERRSRLGEQDQVRLHRQRTGDRHPLLLSAGQLARPLVDMAGQMPARQLGRQAKHSSRANGNVVERRQVGKQARMITIETDSSHALPPSLDTVDARLVGLHPIMADAQRMALALPERARAA